MEQSKKKKMLLVFALLFVTVLAGTLAVRTYAKYTSTLNSEASATIAKWAFASDNESTALTLNLDKTYDPDTLVANKIAPGTSGSFSIQLSNANTEVGVDYSIALTDTTGAPTNLKFYSDSAHTTELTNATYTGTLSPNAAATTITIYWEWPYETIDGDTVDTTEGATAGSMTVKATITGTQVQPE